jgi:LPXTG-motif cell wall-anchored protein
MKSHLRAGLIALASVPIALTATGSAAAVTLPEQPAHTALVNTLIDPTPSVSPSPSPSPSPSAAESPWPSTAASASAPTNSNLDPEPRTNLTAVVDPIAVPVRDGVLIRVGVRNSGPLSITAPAGQPAVTLSLVIDLCCLLIAQVKSLGGCQIGYSYPPNWPTFPAEPRRFDCSSTRTLRVRETYWESFVFPNLSSLARGVSVAVRGYAQDPDDRDNRRNVVVRLAGPGSSLPVTGTRTFSIAGAGLALVIAGTMAIWYGRRRRLIQPTGSVHTVADESTS